ncbi:MAG: DUF2442 domain-containing protein [Rikenellaceae bacterium]
MKTIENIWFETGRIYMLCSDTNVYSKPLELFPTLKSATEIQRNNFAITMRGEALRWAEIDEDIHISSFFEEVEIETENEVAQIFKNFPWLNISEVARAIGIHKSLLSKYIYGVKKPSKERVELIKSTLKEMGSQLVAI